MKYSNTDIPKVGEEDLEAYELRIDIGTKVEANWGAMYATREGEVVSIDYKTSHAKIVWELHEDEENYLENYHIPMNEIREPGYRSGNGSPIGVFRVPSDGA